MNKIKLNKRICIIFPKDSSAIFDNKSKETFGGATVQMFLLAKEFSTYEHIDVRSLVVDFGRKNGDVIKGLKIYNIFSKKNNLFEKILKFHKGIHKLKPDLIIQHGLTIFSCLLAAYCRIFRIKFVYLFASDVEAEGCYQRTNKKAMLFKLLIKYSDVLISQNKYQYYKISTDYGRKTDIIHNGFPLKKSSDVDRKFVLWVGRAERLKNPLKFIHLASNNPKYNFVMICNKLPGQENYFNEIKHFADQVKNLEFISQVPFNKIDAYFRDAKLLINTSDYEGFPNVFIQATMNKVPIVSLNANPDNFITKYKCGIFCDGDDALMNQSIQKLLRYFKKWNALSEKAYNYAKEKHDIKKNTRALYDLIFKKELNL